MSETKRVTERSCPIARDALPLFVPPAVVGIAFLVLNWWIAGGAILALALFILYFFRVPRLEYEYSEGDILSPAYGKVVAIADVTEPEFMHCNVKRISIFLRIYDIHINYSPVDGRLQYKKYHKGRFGIAGFDKASDLNEHMTVGVENGDERLSFKIIAGMIARRIIMPLNKGTEIRAGEKIGMVKFGSRADVFVPMDYEILVDVGQKVRGPLTVLARRK